MRVVKYWDRWPRSIVEALSLEVFKCQSLHWRPWNNSPLLTYHLHWILQEQLHPPGPSSFSSSIHSFCASYQHSADGPPVGYWRELNRACKTCLDHLNLKSYWRMMQTLQSLCLVRTSLLRAAGVLAMRKHQWVNLLITQERKVWHNSLE